MRSARLKRILRPVRTQLVEYKAYKKKTKRVIYKDSNDVSGKLGSSHTDGYKNRRLKKYGVEYF